MRKLITYILAAAALAAAGFVIYSEMRPEPSNGSEALEAYLENQGIERDLPAGEETVSHESIDETGVQPGMQAPDFTLETIEGEAFQLSELRGDYVLVNMWATWCGPCKDEMPDFAQFYEEYKEEGVNVVGVNMTSTETGLTPVEQFVDDFSLPFTNVLDKEGEIESLYEVYAMPSTYLITPDGRVAMNRPGLINYDVLVETYEEVRENNEAS
ncbi:alkyl hydroperoxide reductase [Alkalicoccus urumqiensis]|uniref:Alkyl hydroperoxide reductase n=2 Tax=Alkalicoccus urumqiensis TaxID=1548213 RepID=A0A2P6MKE5_ALKUR|nr:alkyl hydroperoxide reductase [Alkalicoccus urumqiensis]